MPPLPSSTSRLSRRCCRSDLICPARRWALPGVGGVAIAGDGVGVGQVDQQAGTCADEFRRESGECGGELVDGLERADAGEGVTVPSVEMGVAENRNGSAGSTGSVRSRMLAVSKARRASSA